MQESKDFPCSQWQFHPQPCLESSSYFQVSKQVFHLPCNYVDRRTCVNIIITTCTANTLVSCHADTLEKDSKQTTILVGISFIHKCSLAVHLHVAITYNVLPSTNVEPEAPTNTSSHL